MDVHSHIHESYARTGDERRHYGLSPLSSTSFPPGNHYDIVAHDLSPVGAHAHSHSHHSHHNHHNHHHHHHHPPPHTSDRIPTSAALLNDLSMARQTISTPSQYTPPSTMMHTSYDPVHGIYGIARMASNNGSSPSLSSYTHDNYARSDRPASSYGQYTTTSANDYHEPYARTSSISPLDDQRRDRPQLPSPSELEWPSYKASLSSSVNGSGGGGAGGSSGGGQNVHSHSFRVQQGLSSSTVGDLRPATYSSGSSDRSTTTFPTISPSPALTSNPTTAEETPKPNAKRIVMACHQCRGRKIRCDAERPSCKNCVRRREDCKYDAKPKRRGPDKIPGSRMRSCKSKKQTMVVKKSPDAPSLVTPYLQQQQSQQHSQTQQQQAQPLVPPLPANEG